MLSHFLNNVVLLLNWCDIWLACNRVFITVRVKELVCKSLKCGASVLIITFKTFAALRRRFLSD
jgi:hypothetical protein